MFSFAPIPCYTLAAYRNMKKERKIKKPKKQVFVTECHCGQPAFAWGLCQKHYDEASVDLLPTHNDWRLT